MTFTVKVESGDIVVMGSDGIFDNLFDEDILEEVVRCIGGVDPNQNQSQDHYGTGSPARAGKGVSGLWSELTSSAAKLASTSSSTIAAITGVATTTTTTTTATADATATSAPEGAESTATFFNTSEGPDSPCELSPLAAAAIAAAHSTAMPPSAALYSISTASQRRHERRIPEPSVICDALAKRAKNVSEDTRHHGSPFQSRAMQEGLYYQGGKRDDMSVLVAIIKVAEDSPDRR
jgi:hypothetical protein